MQAAVAHSAVVGGDVKGIANVPAVGIKVARDEDVEVEWIRLASRVFNLVFVATDTFVGGEVVLPGQTARPAPSALLPAPARREPPCSSISNGIRTRTRPVGAV